VKALVGALVIAIAAAGCGGDDPFCGDGITQAPEQCDDGNDSNDDFCRDCNAFLPPRTIVKWLFNADAAEGFVQDSCTDVGAFNVEVTMSGVGEPVTLDGMCSERQVVFDDLAPGIYTASVTPLDFDDEPLVGDAVEMQVTVEATDSETTVVIPPAAWIGPYTGTFFFTARWSGQDCAAAGVATQRITLTVDGTVVSQSTTAGLPLNGSASGACQPAANPMPQSALLVPFGVATIEIVGFDAGAAEIFRGTFDTFVGAGISNPTLAFDVIGPAECDAYCTAVAANCSGAEAQYGSTATCLAACAAFPQGTLGDMSGNSLECRAYHAGAAASDATTHCVHAGPGGAGVCGANCDGYCQIVLDSCTGVDQVYATLGDCTTACAGFTDTEKYDASDMGGDTLACRLYHATAASTDPVTHCGHTQPVSATCN